MALSSWSSVALPESPPHSHVGTRPSLTPTGESQDPMSLLPQVNPRASGSSSCCAYTSLPGQPCDFCPVSTCGR